jgi:hypothetical protein
MILRFYKNARNQKFSIKAASEGGKKQEQSVLSFEIFF